MILHLLIFFSMSAWSTLESNDKACTQKALGDTCNCTNTGWEGFCFPGSQSVDENDLRCDCESDVYSHDEALDLIIKLFCQQPTRRSQLANLAPGLYSILNSIFTKVGNNPSKERLRRNDLQSERTQLTKLFQDQNAIRFFFNSHDGCWAPGDVCTCSNTGREGICSINREVTASGKNTGRKAETIYCHCG